MDIETSVILDKIWLWPIYDIFISVYVFHLYYKSMLSYVKNPLNEVPVRPSKYYIIADDPYSTN